MSSSLIISDLNYCMGNMSGSLIISDLNYLQTLDQSSSVVGGGSVYAGTVTTTNIGLGYAVAGAGAVAIGQTTYTNTQTNTTVKNLGMLNYSIADATAIAYAKTGDQKASYSSFNTSIFMNFTHV
ncbi:MULTISPECIES: TonB-dependent receptor [unclassified Microcoleus]|uniref:TonB-dependent receptor n=1 Tax=unclassified Microcoleus TaxID=2642155 RepID=UPI002FCFF3C0